MTNKIQIAGQLYDDTGLTLPDREFRDFWMGPVDGVVEIDIAAALPAHKAKLSAQIDADAEAFWLQFITPGDGMQMTYREKFEQSKAADVAGKEAIDALTEAEGIAAYPTLAASVGIEAETMWDCAQLVIAKAEAWADLSNAIERKRLMGKKAIKDAATLEDVQAAYDAVAWS